MMGEPRFRDRPHAGRTLAADLREYAGRDDVLVLGLPRGGVPVAFEVAQALDAPLDVFIVRKLGVPGHEELAMGALATGGVRVLNDAVVHGLRIPEQVIDAVAAREQRELERRERAYRDGRPAPRVSGRTVILVDDGLATGATMRAAAQALRLQHPARVIIDPPVGYTQLDSRVATSNRYSRLFLDVVPEIGQHPDCRLHRGVRLAVGLRCDRRGHPDARRRGRDLRGRFA